MTAPIRDAAEHRRRGIGRRLIACAPERRRAAGDGVMPGFGDPSHSGPPGFRAASARSFHPPSDGPHPQAIALHEAGFHPSGAVADPRAFAGPG